MAHLLDSLVGFPKVSHTQRTYNWEILLPDMWSGGLILGYPVSKYCQNISFGQYSIGEVVELRSGPLKQFYPGLMSIDTVSATFVCPIPDIVMVYFVRWRERIVDKNGYYFPATNYKRNIYILLYDRTGIPCNTIMLVGCFPIKFPAYRLAYGEESVVRYLVDFKVEKIRMGLKAAERGIEELSERIPGAVGSVASKVKSFASKLGQVAGSLGGW